MNRAILALLPLALVSCERATAPSAVSDGTAEASSGPPVRTFVEEPSSGLKSAQDQQESSEVLQFITEHFAGTPPPKLYCKGGSNSTHIHVYGITQPAEQDRMVDLVRAELPKRRWKQVYIIFRDREHFAAQANGRSKRAGEKKLYSILIKKP